MSILQFPESLQILQHKIEESLIIIEQMFKLSSNPYISLSFGKDSLVMADLVTKLNPKIPCLFLKSEFSYYLGDFESLIEFYRTYFNNLIVIEGEFFGDLQSDFDGVFIGLRLKESKKRKMSLLRKENNEHGKFIMRYKHDTKEAPTKGIYRCCPVAMWEFYEEELYLSSFNLPYLKLYDDFGFTQRTSTWLDDYIKCNDLQKIKNSYPEKWNYLVTLNPDLRLKIS